MSVRRFTIATDTPAKLSPPDKCRTLSDINVSRHVYSSLIEYNHVMEFHSRLLKEFWSDEGGQDYHFLTAAELFFQDGRPIDADSIAWNLRQWIFPIMGLVDLVERIEVMTPRELAVHLRAPYQPFLDALASPFAGLRSPKSFSGGNDNGAYLPVGSGSFVPIAAPGGDIVLERRGAGTDVTELTFSSLSDGGEMLRSLQEGKVDVIYECPYESVHSNGPRVGHQLISLPSLNVNVLAFNLKHPSLKDIDCRRLIRRLIDRCDLMKRVYSGIGDIPTGPIAAGSQYFDPDLSQNDDDLPARVGTLPTLQILVQNGFNRHWLDVLAEQLAHGGIAVTYDMCSPRALSQRMQRGQFDAVLTGFNNTVEPSRFFFDFFHSEGQSNFCQLCDPEIDDLIERALFSLDAEARRVLYRQISCRINLQTPMIFLRNGKSIIGRSSRTGSVVPHPDIYLRLEHIADVPTVD